MASQATLRSTGDVDPPGRRSSSPAFSEVAGDLLKLVELQVRLVALDLKESSSKVRRTLSLLLAALSVGLAAGTVLLGAFGMYLAERLHWSPAAGLAAAAGAGVLLTATLLAAGISAAKGAVDVFARSRAEFLDNVVSIKRTLVGDPSPVSTTGEPAESAAVARSTGDGNFG